MTPDERLSELFASEAGGEGDTAFTAAVMTRVARRRAWLSLAAAAPWTITVGVLVWALGPVLRLPVDGMAQDLASAAPPAAAVLAVTASALIAAQQARRALGAR